MKRVFSVITRLLFISLTMAPIAPLASHLLLGDWRAGFVYYALAVALGCLITLVPKSVGNYKVEKISLSARSRGPDPDPDRERAQIIEKKSGFRLPLRSMCSIVFLLGMVALGAFFPVAGALWYKSGCFFLALAVIAVVAMRAFPSPESSFFGAQGIIAGGIIYFAAGVTMWALRRTDVADINSALYALAAAYFLLSVFMLNEYSIMFGYNSTGKARPSSKIRTANRIMSLVFAAALFVISLFDNIRAGFVAAWEQIKLWVGAFIAWIQSFFPAEESPAGEMPSEVGGGEAMMMEGGEPALIWVILEKIFIWIAAIIGAAAVCWLLYKFYLVIKSLVKKIAAAIKKYARELGDDYEDTQESILDWDEVKREAGARARRFAKLFEREKRFEQLNARDKARYVVRGIYRRSNANPGARTLREDISSLDLREADRETALELYERARYSEAPVTDEECERLKKEARV